MDRIKLLLTAYKLFTDGFKLNKMINIHYASAI